MTDYQRNHQDVAILLIDIADFTKLYDSIQKKRLILNQLQEVLTDAAHFFMPYGNPWEKWTRHGTGDGYYFIFDSLPTQISLNYGIQIGELLNGKQSESLPLRLRMVLSFGDVEWIRDQILSDSFSEAERFISNGQFKTYANSSQNATSLAATSLYYTHLNQDFQNQVLFKGVH